MDPADPDRRADGGLIEAAAAELGADPVDLLSALTDQAPFGLALLDLRLRWRYVNPAVQRLTGHPAEQLTGSVLGPRSARTLERVLADGRTRTLPVSDLLPLPHPGDRARRPLTAVARRLELHGRPVGLVIAVTTVEPAPDRHDLEHARARLTLLDAAAERIGTTLDIGTTCTELADFTVPRLADLATIDVLPPEAAVRDSGAGGSVPRLRRTAVARAPHLRGRLAELALPGESIRYLPGTAAARCLATGKPVAVNQLTPQELTGAAADPATAAAYRAAGVDALLEVPLTARGQLIGMLSLARTGEASPSGFTDDDVVLVQDLAGRAALSIDNARRYTRSQGIALELQRALLAEPGSPHPNLELASRYLPSGTSSVVGGDWYETVRLPFGRTLLVMGDVMGHGVEAAVDMSSYRSMLRYVASMDLPPHRILRQLDHLISENESARPATCLLALADPARQRWTLSSAGHLPPALLTADRPIELLDVPTGPPLGTGLGGYEQTTRELAPGQVLMLYTDGLVERRGEDIDASLARLAGLHLPVGGDLDDLLDATLRGLTPQDAEDDIALLAARARIRS
ncbi:SpoIIE family protein phosphatase [Kitasatospora viridis]|uniref:PAS domain-containing protein n=1 Tax=Kitasatospora viridis TaxID=281105 RepID=A0A561SFA6_9ACTN|nr:SpoIIE family protein phosphatase [Kitasatospora viridis]TWF73550.1 PAS domain-containing protein [Kitasatospora viridis]